MRDMVRSQSSPLIVAPEGVEAPRLKRLYLGSGTHDEDWLQGLLHGNPSLLPISDIEPGFGEPIAIAREISCAHGAIDNLFITPAGEIILVEVKLWRNNQARREVVAQALDYVAALTELGFEQFETIAAKAMDGPQRLYDRFAGHPDALDEADFIDAVAMNLARGRMLVLALGDGIKRETETLSGLLQSHAGAHFTFALVELATWQNTATREIIVVPNTLAKTVMIERGIVRIENGIPKVVPVPKEAHARPQSLSMTSFLDSMAERHEGLPSAIRGFLDHVEPLGVYAEQLASLNFKVDVEGFEKPVNLGYIQKNGQLWTDAITRFLPQEIWEPYLESLASVIDGSIANAKNSYVSIDGKSAPRIEDILPKHAETWAKAIEELIFRIRHLDDGE